jgi:hypothetical protein
MGTGLEGEVLMRKFIAALLAVLLTSSTVVFATEPGRLTPASVEKAIRVHSTVAVRQADAQQSAEDTKPWIERHPIWFGLIAGSSAGALWGAWVCQEGCLFGQSGAAMIGSWYGAGPGALIGWAVGRAK